jgi:hypothetical protein
MVNRQQETQKILNLLRTEKIEWGSKYEEEGYTIYIPIYDNTATLEDNLQYAGEEINAQIYHQPQE